MGTDGESHSSKNKYECVADALERAIEKGKYRAGDKIPSIRMLARDFSVAKNTVISALQHLESKSLIEAKAKSGFTVRQVLNFTPPSSPVFKDIRPSLVSIPDLLQEVIAKGAAFDIKPSEPVPAEHNLIVKLHRHINKAMRTQSVRKTLYYDEPMGFGLLREQIAHHYGRLNLPLHASELCITGGCQHALLLSLMATCEPGDNVIIESPGYYGIIQLLDELGLHAIEIPCHSVSGLDVDVLSQVLTRYDVKACVVTPAFSTPTGSCMPDDAKVRVLELAEKYDFAVIEDDIYGDLGFKFRPKPIKYFDRTERVILCSSFSKSLSRDLRTGWIVGSRWQKKIRRLNLVTHLAGNQAIQTGLATFLASGDFIRYLNYRTTQLELCRNSLLNLLVNHWGNSVRFTNPSGGLSTWVELTEDIDTLDIYYRAIEHQIILTPGALFTSHNDFSRFLRLSYCHPITDGREAAIVRISDVVNP
jgi:DNA-binding transcriptional MocR family regulator